MTDLEFEKRREKEQIEKIVRDGGFYNNNGVWNSVIRMPDGKLYRNRVETIIVRNGKEVFLKKKPNGEYFLPGGSTEKDVPNMTQAIRECQEEAHITVRNIESTGISYVKKLISFHNAKPIDYDGFITEVYIAEYDSKYTGEIRKEDLDPFINSGKWYQVKDCFKFFSKEHKDALLFYLKNFFNKEEEKEVTESYIGNYFNNRKLLKKISYNPEVSRSGVEQACTHLKKVYLDLSAKSKIKRERKRKDVCNIFHPVLDYDFSDGSSIAVGICFDDNSFTEGAAVHTDEFGDIILIYPKFFKKNKEEQVYILLHEIGHIRLHHLDYWNLKKNVFGGIVNNDEDRLKHMRKGKAQYTEINADLYAVLSGASMYKILNPCNNKDYDDMYDYRVTNAELAARYTSVYNQYKKLKKDRMYESVFNHYDIMTMAIFEMVYENFETSYLTEDEKDKLYDAIYNLTIHKPILEDVRVKEADKLLSLEEKGTDEYIKVKKERDRIYSEVYEGYYETSIPEEYNKKYSRLQDETSQFVYEKTFCKEKVRKIVQEKYDIMKINQMITESTNDTADRILYLLESLTTAERKAIPIEKFGIPETRSYPLDTKKHVTSAIKLFWRCDKKYREILAKNIKKAMEEYSIPLDYIGDENPLKKYL